MNQAKRKPLPHNFLWGTAISAHQSEGNNINSDAWLCEHVAPSAFSAPSGDACDSYHRYEEDIAIAASLGLNCYRVGIEWARIEPEPGQFSIAELDRYRRLFAACRERGLATMVTFSHFSVPRWFAARGGFEAPDAADLFARYAGRAAAHFGELMTYATTFNEANIQRLLALIPKSPERVATVAAMLAAAAKTCGDARFSSLLFADPAKTEAALLDAHRKASAVIKAEVNIPVGVTLTMQDIQAPAPVAAHLSDALYGPWLDEAARSDFIGVQTYTRILMRADGQIAAPEGAELTGAGYEFYPQALAGTIRLAAQRTGRPVYVTENGIATDDDRRRIAFIDAALRSLRDCIDEGIDVRGYIHWSLLDNFEWTSGYGHHFGLVAVDPVTFERTPKPSAHHLGALAAKEQQ
jgi:beta-glucosidase